MNGALGVITYGLGTLLGLVFLTVLVFWFVQDVTQTKHTILRNFPVIGRLRYLFERQGEYFRQYFFANDREEMPFNRAMRSWVYRLAKDEGGTIGFGSTNNMSEPGNIIFVNAAFPVLEEGLVPAPSLVIGQGFCREPFEARSLVNISGMSYGAISAPAVRALSRGAKEAGCWMDTGEGGLSPHHREGGCDIIMQIGTAKYGVRDGTGELSEQRVKEIAPYVRAFEIKLSQGAKPGKGGILPGAKVTAEIAAIRGIPPHRDSISPNRHRAQATPGSTGGWLLQRPLDRHRAADLPDGVAAGTVVWVFALQALHHLGCDHGVRPVAGQTQRLDRDRFHVAKVAPLGLADGFRVLEVFRLLPSGSAAIEFGEHSLLPWVGRSQQRVARLQADTRNPGAGLPRELASDRRRDLAADPDRPLRSAACEFLLQLGAQLLDQLGGCRSTGCQELVGGLGAGREGQAGQRKREGSSALDHGVCPVSGRQNEF